MKFHTFGACDRPVMLLIHGVLTPWKIWEPQIEFFSKDYNVIVPALDGHDGEDSVFHSLEEEAAQIEAYCLEQVGAEIEAACGLSMGGCIAHLLWKSGKLNIKKLVMDGAPLSPYGEMLSNIMTRQYLDIIHSSKERDPQTLEACKQVFLPERYLEDYLEIANHMSDESVRNMVRAVGTCQLDPGLSMDDTQVLYLHGDSVNEFFAKKTAKQMKQYYPDAEIRSCEGYDHCELAVFHPEQWIALVEAFLEGK